MRLVIGGHNALRNPIYNKVLQLDCNSTGLLLGDALFVNAAPVEDRNGFIRRFATHTVANVLHRLVIDRGHNERSGVFVVAMEGLDRRRALAKGSLVFNS